MVTNSDKEEIKEDETYINMTSEISFVKPSSSGQQQKEIQIYSKTHSKKSKQDVVKTETIIDN